MSAGDKVTLVQYRTLRPVQAEEGATYGGTLGVNLYRVPGVLLKLSDLTSTATAGSAIDTTDDVEEGQWNLWFTNRRAQDAVGGILTDTDTIDLAYTAGTSIAATLKDLPNTATGTLQAITRDAQGRVSGSRDATITGTDGHIAVANGNAAAGLPTIDLDAAFVALIDFLQAVAPNPRVTSDNSYRVTSDGAYRVTA